jgi:hypothetical protein
MASCGYDSIYLYIILFDTQVSIWFFVANHATNLFYGKNMFEKFDLWFYFLLFLEEESV